MTLAAELVSERRQRLARIAARAVPDVPIACVSASARAGGLVVRQALPMATTFDSKVEPPPLPPPSSRLPTWYALAAEVNKGVIFVEDIQYAVADDYKITRANIVSGDCRLKFARPRAIAVYLARKITGHAYKAIGERFGHRDHSTIRSAYFRVAALIARDPELAARVEAIRGRLINA